MNMIKEKERKKEIVSSYSNFACRKKERYHGLFSGGLEGYLYVNRVKILMRNSEIIFLILLQGTFQYYGKHLRVASCKTGMRRENSYIFIAVSLLYSAV